MKAYGACIYFRAVYSDNTVSCHLIASKSRIAPIKTTTLPRLELCSCLLLSQLLQKMISIFKNKFTFSSINLWSDSSIVLAWIASQNPSRWSIFVSNRVSEIQQLTGNATWRHIPSKENPADCLSRGLSPTEILSIKLWWHGPEVLNSPVENLSEVFASPNLHNLEIPEQRKVNLFYM